MIIWAALRKKVPNVLSRCHTSTKRRTGARGRARLSFGMTPTFFNPSFFWCDNDSGHSGPFAVTLHPYVSIFLFTDISRCNGVAVDWISHHVYWTDETRQTVEMADYSGQYRRILVHVGLRWPRGIVVDPIDRLVM